MRIACISDIHGNIYALNKVLEHIDEKDVDQIICLGDLTGFGPHPNEVVALIRRRRILCLKGNYDASVADNSLAYIKDNSDNSFSLPWTFEELRASHRFYLESLPEKLTLNFEDKSLLFVHASPKSIDENIDPSSEDTDLLMEELQADALICGHTHIPFIKEFDNKLLINAGSVGKPRTGSPNATYVILNVEKGRPISAEINSVSYDLQKTIKDMEIKDFPSSIIYSIKSGSL